MNGSESDEWNLELDSEVNRKPMHRGPDRGDMSKQPSNTILD